MSVPVTNPRPLATLLDRGPTRSVQPVTNTPTLVVPADVDRSYFIVMAEIPSIGTLSISPDSVGTYQIRCVGDENYILIDSSRFPTLAQQEWYINTPNPTPTPIYVIEVRRTSGVQ